MSNAAPGSDIIPEGFDFRAAQYAESTTPPEKKKRCPEPECKSTRVVKKSPRGSRAREFEEDYFCEECFAHFDNPIQGVNE